MTQKYMTIFFITIAVIVAGCGESNDPPSTPMITPSSTAVITNQQVIFTALAADPDGDLITYDW